MNKAWRSVSLFPVARTLHCTVWRPLGGAERFQGPSAKLKRSFQLLDLSQDECTEEEIRKAYIRLAKKYHPDSSSGEANADRFSEVREAYKKCISYAKNVSMSKDIHAALEQELADIDKHLGYSASRQKRLAHRQYLSYDVGVGTISQREKAHSQQRINQAMDSVFDKQFQKALENPDAKEIEPYQGRKSRGGKSTKSIQRIANEIIFDSMKKGEFENLRGQGKPLKLDPINPALDNIEQKINQMLSNSGFAPEWISLDKEIRTAIDRLKADMEVAWNKCGPHPMGQEQQKLWDQQVALFKESIEGINKKVFNLNLIVPSLTSQRSQLRMDRLLSEVMETLPNPSSAEELMEAVKEEREADPLGGLFEKISSATRDFYNRFFHQTEMKRP